MNRHTTWLRGMQDDVATTAQQIRENYTRAEFGFPLSSVFGDQAQILIMLTSHAAYHKHNSFC